MNQSQICNAAKSLDGLLDQLAATDSEVAALRHSLVGLLKKALGEEIEKPVEWRDVPGDWWFSEGTLRKYRDLESAYATFKIEVTGGETEVLRRLRMERGQGR